MGWRNVGLHVDGSFASGGTCVHADFEYQSPGSGQGPGPQAAASLLSQPRSSADKGNLTKNTKSLFADYVCVAHTSEKHIPTSSVIIMSKSASQSIDISPLAYRKIVYHSAKYLSSTVVGVLVGTKSQSNKPNTTVTDIIPLVHHWHTLSPMTEAGMALVRSIYRIHRPNCLFRSRHTLARLAGRSWVCMKFPSVLIKKSPLPQRQP